MGTFADVLQSRSLTPEQILRMSARLEKVQNEDRELIRKRAEKRRRTPNKSYEEVGIAKPRSGRVLQPGHLAAAMEDKPVPGPVRTKLLRAVNALVEKKGGQPLRTTDLFGTVPGKQGKKPRS